MADHRRTTANNVAPTQPRRHVVAMQGPSAPQAPHAPPQSPKKLDTVVKLGLGVFVSSFILIGVGMFLSRPDRSIPPYSVGSQEGT
ncbi:MAG: hypothetical protein ACREJW_11865, partial [Candidatus Methylomirabilales bacterium]